MQPGTKFQDNDGIECMLMSITIINENCIPDAMVKLIHGCAYISAQATSELFFGRYCAVYTKYDFIYIEDLETFFQQTNAFKVN